MEHLRKYIVLYLLLALVIGVTVGTQLSTWFPSMFSSAKTNLRQKAGLEDCYCNGVYKGQMRPENCQKKCSGTI